MKADSTEEQKDHQVVRQYLLQPSGWKGFLPLKKMACLAILVPPMLSRSCASSSLRQCIFIVATPLTMSSRPIPSSTHSAFCPLKKNNQVLFICAVHIPVQAKARQNSMEGADGH